MNEAVDPAGADEGLTELRRSFDGAVLAPTNEGFYAARRCFNALVDRRPAVIVRCLHAGDVGRAFDFGTRVSKSATSLGASTQSWSPRMRRMRPDRT